MKSHQPAAAALLWLFRRLQIWMIGVEFVHQHIPVLTELLSVLLLSQTAMLDRLEEVNARLDRFFRERRVIAGERIGLLLQDPGEPGGDGICAKTGLRENLVGISVSSLGPRWRRPAGADALRSVPARLPTARLSSR